MKRRDILCRPVSGRSRADPVGSERSNDAGSRKRTLGLQVATGLTAAEDMSLEEGIFLSEGAVARRWNARTARTHWADPERIHRPLQQYGFIGSARSLLFATPSRESLAGVAAEKVGWRRPRPRGRVRSPEKISHMKRSKRRQRITPKAPDWLTLGPRSAFLSRCAGCLASTPEGPLDLTLLIAGFALGLHPERAITRHPPRQTMTNCSPFARRRYSIRAPAPLRTTPRGSDAK